MQLPDVFYVEILSKLDVRTTLNLAQVSKAYRDTVWGADGVRSMKAKIKTHLVKIGMKALITEPFFWATRLGNVPAVRALLKSGVDVDVNFTDRTALLCAAEEGHTPVVKALIEAGADVDKKAYCGQTPLHVAAVTGHAPVITELIKAGADVNATDEDGLVPLHYAVDGRDEDCVAVLLAHGADVHKADDEGMTPMLFVVQHKQKKIIEMLKQAGG